MNRALMAAGLVDRVQVTIFPVISGQTGLDPILHGAGDFDLELVPQRTPFSPMKWHTSVDFLYGQKVPRSKHPLCRTRFRPVERLHSLQSLAPRGKRAIRGR
jgi:hypothetical protein